MQAQEWASDWAALTAGVRELRTEAAGPVFTLGPRAFPVVVAPSGEPVVSAAHWPQAGGRIVALGHSGWLSSAAMGHADTLALVCNAVRWVAKKDAPRVATLWMEGSSTALGARFAGLRVAQALDDVTLASADVLVLGERTTNADTRSRAALRRWLSAGGGLVCALCPWGWMQLSKSDLAESWLQQLVWEAGLAFGPSCAFGPHRVGSAAPDAASHSLLALRCAAWDLARATAAVAPPTATPFSDAVLQLVRGQPAHPLTQSTVVQAWLRTPPRQLVGPDDDADCCALVLPPPPAWRVQACASMTHGVRSLHVGDAIWGPAFPFGADACAIVMARASSGNAEVPVVAAARHPRSGGRVVALGHSTTLQAAWQRAHADHARFISNCLVWASGLSALPVTVVALHCSPALDTRCFSVVPSLRHLKAGVVVALGEGDLSETDVAAIAAHVATGGGLVTAMCPWGWCQLHPHSALTDAAPQRLIGEVGLCFTAGYTSPTTGTGFVVTNDPTLPHVNVALDVLTHFHGRSRPVSELHLDAREQLEAASRLASEALPHVPSTAPLLVRASALADAIGAARVPSAEAPIRAATSPLERFAVSVGLALRAHLPAERIRAHPAHAVFPGPCPTSAAAPNAVRTLQVDCVRQQRWVSTGLYACAGGVVRASCSAACGLALRIGCHCDSLVGLEDWARIPEVTLQQAMPCTVASAFGGLLYVVVPENPAAAAAVVSVRIEGAFVDAPTYWAGRTTAAQWAQVRRTSVAPWAELVTSKVCITVPASCVRDLADPAPLLQFWDRVSDAAADLASLPRERAWPWRYVADVAISAGYMHAGYPCMTHLDAAPRLVDVELLRREGEWGLFHELGHNHQAPEWTFDGTLEVTCNLFTCYINHVVVGLPLHGTQKDLTPDARAARFRRHVHEGVPWAVWKQEPFLALIMYLQVVEAFGWGPIRSAIAQYRTGKVPAPVNDDQKRDTWMVTLSRCCNRNLGPFFVQWGVPVSQVALASIALLPEWR